MYIIHKTQAANLQLCLHGIASPCLEIRRISDHPGIAMAEAISMVPVRGNGKIKAQASKALTAMGQSVSDADSCRQAAAL